MKTPSTYVFYCSAAGFIVDSFIERQDFSSSGSAIKDCIFLGACEAHESLPQSAEFLTDVFTSCLTTPIKMALRWFLYPVYPLICVAVAAVSESFPVLFRDKYAPNDKSLIVMIAKILRPLALGLILCASHSQTFSLINGYSALLEVYKHFEHHEDIGIGYVLCVGSEWHRFPSSFFIPDYVAEVQWIGDGFRGLLPLPFNATLGGTAASPPQYFNDKNKASDQQFGS